MDKDERDGRWARLKGFVTRHCRDRSLFLPKAQVDHKSSSVKHEREDLGRKLELATANKCHLTGPPDLMDPRFLAHTILFPASSSRTQSNLLDLEFRFLLTY